MARVPLKDKDREARVFLIRVSIASVGVAVLCVILLIRLFDLQVVRYRYYANLSRQNSVNPMPVQPVRGLILDRQGIVLAENFPVFSLDIIPSHVHDLPALITELKPLIALNGQDLLDFDRRLHQLHPYDRVVLRSHLTEEEAARIAVNLSRLDGVQLRARLERYYPLGGLAVAAIGYVSRITDRDLAKIDHQQYAGIQHIGRIGIEASYQSELLGRVGFKQVEINAHGRAVRVLSSTEPVAGRNLYLNIDAHMQAIAEKAMGGYAGGVVAINPQTGAVLTFVSMPTYDPNRFVDGISVAAYDALRNNPAHPLVNRALVGEYAPGSTIKPFYAFAGLALGKIDPHRLVDCPGVFHLEGSAHLFHCWKRGGHGYVDLHHAIEESCDVYFYKLAARLGIDDMTRFLSYFGFGRKTGIDIGGEQPGLVPSPAWQAAHNVHWYAGETIVTGIGQGQLLVTPLQLANAVAALSMDGKRFHPSLVYATENPDTKRVRYVHADAATAVPYDSPAFYGPVIDGMKAVIYGRHGTAPITGINAPYLIAGKTGTAQVHTVIAGERYQEEAEIPLKDRDDAVFEAFAPVGDPQIAVAVVMEHGGHGGDVGAPIARALMDYYLLKEGHLAGTLPGPAAPSGAASPPVAPVPGGPHETP